MRLVLLLYLILFVQQDAKATKKTRVRGSNEKEEISSYRGLDLRGTLRKSLFTVTGLQQPHNNTICSPMSALFPLGKLALGAEDASLDELLTVIGVTKIEKLKPHFKYLIAEMRYMPGVKLNVASRMYISKQDKLQSKFSDGTKEIFTSSAEKVDFKSPVYTADRINSWVESQTGDKIHDIVSANEITPDLSLILVNAVYFMYRFPITKQGRWVEPFSSVQTATFYSPLDVRRVAMMSVTSHFNYTDCESLDAKILKIPYNGGKASFVAVLPNTKNGLPLLLNQLKLAPEILDSALGAMTRRYVQVTLPKFKIESELDLKGLYEKIGLKRVFNEHESGLKGIVKEKTLVVSRAKQKTFIDVNEYGTEAAAASSTLVTKLISGRAEQFRADHPFLFFVLSNKQQLFAGTLVAP